MDADTANSQLQLPSDRASGKSSMIPQQASSDPVDSTATFKMVKHPGRSSERTRLIYELVNALSLAWDSIRTHKLRSFLTLLGVIIGVASVILVGAAIDGLGLYAQQSTAKAFGSESYLIAQVASAGNMTRRQYFDKIKYNRQIKVEDDRYLQSLNGANTLYSP